MMSRRRIDGRFTEDIEMDIKHGAFERISVPPILESRRSTVLHDFETVISSVPSIKMYFHTAKCHIHIIDSSKEGGSCKFCLFVHF